MIHISRDLICNSIYCRLQGEYSEIKPTYIQNGLGQHRYKEGKCLRHRCAASQTVLGFFPGGVTGFFSEVSPSDRSMALGSTQPLVKMSTRNIPEGKDGRCVRLTNSQFSRAECHEICGPKPAGSLWAKPDLLRDSFNFLYFLYEHIDMAYFNIYSQFTVA